MSKRQLRGQFTGGVSDINDFFAALKVLAAAKGWEESWFDVKPFGDFGPLHKITFGFVLGEEEGLDAG